MAKRKGLPTPRSIADMDEIYQELLKEHGDETIYWGSDERLEVQKLPLGIEPLDRVLGGGFALGRITELIGEWSSGKSLLSLFALKSAQERGYACAYIDSERTFDPEWARVLGVDPSKLLIPRPKTGDTAFDILKRLCEARFGLVVLDSLASLAPTARLEADSVDSLPALQARMINQGLLVINAVNNITSVVLINQLRESIGVMFGNPETLPGGKAQRFYASLMVRVRRGEWIEEDFPGRKDKEKKRKVGFHLKIIVEKNKQGGGFQYDHAEVPFLFSGVIDVVAGLVPMAIDMGVIRQEGASYWIRDDEKIYGRKKLVERVAGDEGLQEWIREQIEGVPEF